MPKQGSWAGIFSQLFYLGKNDVIHMWVVSFDRPYPDVSGIPRVCGYMLHTHRAMPLGAQQLQCCTYQRVNRASLKPPLGVATFFLQAAPGLKPAYGMSTSAMHSPRAARAFPAKLQPS